MQNTVLALTLLGAVTIGTTAQAAGQSHQERLSTQSIGVVIIVAPAARSIDGDGISGGKPIVAGGIIAAGKNAATDTMPIQEIRSPSCVLLLAWFYYWSLGYQWLGASSRNPAAGITIITLIATERSILTPVSVPVSTVLVRRRSPTAGRWPAPRQN